MTEQESEVSAVGADLVKEILGRRMERSMQIYNHALTSLWLGNGGAALAGLSLIGATGGGQQAKILLMPLSFFVVGLIAMAIGSLLSLVNDAKALDRLQRTDSILDLHLQDFQSPRERVGLSLLNSQTKMALVSGVCFVIGCVFGMSIIWMEF